MTRWSRRECLGLGAAGGASLLAPSSFAQIRRSGPPRLKLSLAAYSYRDYLGAKTQPKMSLHDFVDHAARMDLDAVELTSYWFPETFGNDYLSSLKRHCYQNGLDISGTPIRNEFTYPEGAKRDAEIAHVIQWIDHAANLGAPCIRIFAGSIQSGSDLKTAKRYCAECIQACCAKAAERGVLLGLENHGGIVAEAKDLIDIVKAVNNDWCGINLDTGNFRTEDPYGDMARCAPHAVSVQVKTEIQFRGKAKEPADLRREMRILKDAGYRGYVTLEYEAAEEPLNAVPRIVSEMRSML